MNRSTLAALIVALMLGSGAAGYLIGKPIERLDEQPRVAAVTAAPAPAAMPAPAPPAPMPSATPPAATPAWRLWTC